MVAQGEHACGACRPLIFVQSPLSGWAPIWGLQLAACALSCTWKRARRDVMWDPRENTIQELECTRSPCVARGQHPLLPCRCAAGRLGAHHASLRCRLPRVDERDLLQRFQRAQQRARQPKSEDNVVLYPDVHG